jgi:hypothetical protein
VANNDLAIWKMAEAQLGLITRAQLTAIGLSREGIRHRVRGGVFERAAPGVYLVRGVPWSWEQDALAACFWVGDGSAVSGAAAARLYGFDGFERASIEVATVNHKHPRTLFLRSGSPATIHRVDRFLLPEIGDIRGLPVTTPRKTIQDLAGRKHRRTERVVDAALRRELTSVGDLWLYAEQEWMRGRRGVAIMRALLGARTDRKPSDSDAELDMRALIDELGLPPPVHQYPVALPRWNTRIDLAYPDRMLAIEVDGYEAHMDREAFDRDREKDNELGALGWMVRRFTWVKINYEPEWVSSMVADAYQRAGALARV